jgi:hypothetical protein
MSAETENPTNPFVVQGIDRVLTVQRPAVIAHIRSIRSRHPNASPDEVIRILEKRYLTAVTTGGALVGASAVIPGVGVGASLALTTVETGGFLEASALFAQSVTEIHGIVVDDPDRARALVMALVLGNAGSDLVRQFTAQVTGSGPARTAFWGELVTKNLPQAAIGRFADQMKKTFVKRLAVTQGTSAVGRAIPFGIGAVIGGAGNHTLGRQVIAGARAAFPPAPVDFPVELDPKPKVTKPFAERRMPRLKHPKALLTVPQPTAPNSTYSAGAEAEPHDESDTGSPTSS